MSRRTLQRLVALAIVGFSLLLIVVLVTFVFGRGPESDARNFMDLIAQGKAQESYNEASPELREQISADDWEIFTLRAQNLIADPKLVAEDTKVNENKLFAFENPIQFLTYSIVLELENKNDGWRVRHINIQSRPFDTAQFGEDANEQVSE